LSGNAPYVVFYVVAAVFVATALIGRRIPLGQVAKMTLAWGAIFGVAFIIFAFRSELSQIGQRLRGEALGSPIVNGGTVRIPMAKDGHFWVSAKVNGDPVRFMVDSGASVTTISSSVARKAGIDSGSRRGVVNTANGPVLVAQGTADRLELGPIVRTGFPVDVNARDDTNLLGMNFLSSLRGWRVEGGYLILVS
jgi:aspartyl protease family protein